MSAKRNIRRSSPAFIIIVLLITLFSVVSTLFLLHAIIIPPRDTIDPYPFDTAETSAVPPETLSPAESTSVPTETASPDITSESEETAAPAPKLTLLPAAETPAGEDYFPSILFIGDSRTQGLQIATGGYGASFYADRGLSIDGVSTKKFITRTQPNGQASTISILDALTEEPFTEKIYIWLGLNELGWRSTEKFETSYRAQLAEIKRICPDADIVLMALLPVGKNAVVIGVDSNDQANLRIREYNEILLQLAEEAGVYFLNCYEAFVDETGYLPNGYANDGIHLRKEQNLALCDYICAHPIPIQE